MSARPGAMGGLAPWSRSVVVTAPVLVDGAGRRPRGPAAADAVVVVTARGGRPARRRAAWCEAHYDGYSRAVVRVTDDRSVIPVTEQASGASSQVTERGPATRLVVLELGLGLVELGPARGHLGADHLVGHARRRSPCARASRRGAGPPPAAPPGPATGAGAGPARRPSSRSASASRPATASPAVSVSTPLRRSSCGERPPPEPPVAVTGVDPLLGERGVVEQPDLDQTVEHASRRPRRRTRGARARPPARRACGPAW